MLQKVRPRGGKEKKKRFSKGKFTLGVPSRHPVPYKGLQSRLIHLSRHCSNRFEHQSNPAEHPIHRYNQLPR